MSASFIALTGAPWGTIVYTYRNGFQSSYSDYVKMQLRAMVWGPVQVVYYMFRGISILFLIPYNLFILFLDLMYLPVIFASWFLYALKAVLWYMDAAYIISKAWINDPTEFIETTVWLLTDSYLFIDIVFFWWWIPIYTLGMFGAWLFDDTFESRPTTKSLLCLYEYDFCNGWPL